MDISFIIRAILKAVLYYTQIHQPGSSSQMAMAPCSPCSSRVSYDIILDLNTHIILDSNKEPWIVLE